MGGPSAGEQTFFFGGGNYQRNTKAVDERIDASMAIFGFRALYRSGSNITYATKAQTQALPSSQE